MTYIQQGERWATTREKINKVIKVSHAELLADTQLTYTADVNGSVEAGEIYPTTNGQNWEVAASDASDHHATTAGGVKLYEAGPSFSTRARAAAWIARGGTAADGTVISWPGGSVVASSGSTAISDMAGWVPHGRVNFAHWGYTSAGSHDVSDAINYVSGQGGGEIDIDEIITLSATLVLPSKVVIRGKGMFVSGFKAADSLNDDVVRTENFATLTGTDAWLTSAGVPYGFGLFNLQIDGNKANNTSGRGWEVYGKGYFFDNLLILNTAEEAWYSECAYSGGQTDETDLPEGNMGAIFCFQPGTRGDDASHGMIYRGPHDGRIRSLVVSSSDGDGARFESDGSTYNGKCDVDFMHVYGCYGKGIVWSAGGSATHLIGESNDEEGVLVEGNDAQIGMIEAYRNCIRSVGTGREYNVYVDGAGHKIEMIETRDSNNGEGGVNNSSNRSVIGVHCDGQGTSAKTGLVNTGASCIITGHINGYDQSGGVGVDLSGDWNKYDLMIDACDTAIDVSGVGIGNDVKIRADLDTGQTLFTGSDPISGAALNKETSSWDVTAQIASAYYYTRQRKKAGASFDATQAVGTTGAITIGHNIPFTPDPEDVMYGVVFDDGAGGSPAGSPSATITLNQPPSSTQCVFRYVIDRSGSTNDRGFITMHIRY